MFKDKPNGYMIILGKINSTCSGSYRYNSVTQGNNYIP